MTENLPNISDYSTMQDSFLPPNTQGNNVSNLVDAATIGAYNPSGQNVPSSDVSYIQNQMDPLNGQAPAIKDATNEMFMPGLHEPLRVGGTSGQMTGSRDIFVGGGAYVPFAALERRKQAQQDAALKRAADLKSFKLKKPKLSKDPRFNRNLVSTANDFTSIFIGEAEKQYGSREAAMRALTDPTTKIGREFIQQMDNLEILAGEVDQVVDLSAKVDAAIESGDKYISPITRKHNQEFKQLLGKYEGGNAFGAASMRDKLNEMTMAASLDGYIKDFKVLEGIDGIIKQTAGVSDKGDYYQTTTQYNKSYEEGARTAAKNIAQQLGHVTEQDAYNHIMSLKGEESKQSKTMVQKRNDDGGGYNKKEDVIITEEPKVIDINGSQVKTQKSVPFAGTDKQKPVKIDGALVVGADGKTTTYNGIMDFIPVENSLLDNGDRVVRGKQVIKTSDLTKAELKALGYGALRKPPEKIEKDVTINYDNSENAISSQSKNFRITNEAFNDVAPKAVREEVLIDKDNVSTDFKKDFINSGFETVDEYINSEKKKGNNIVLNESSQKEINSIEFNKAVNRERSKSGKKVSPKFNDPTTSSSFNINGETYTKKELMDNGWTEEDLKQLK